MEYIWKYGFDGKKLRLIWLTKLFNKILSIRTIAKQWRENCDTILQEEWRYSEACNLSIKLKSHYETLEESNRVSITRIKCFEKPIWTYDR